MKPKNTICLWFDKDAHEAARFYAATFPDSEVTAVHKAPSDYPGGKQGDVLTVEFTVLGIPCLGLNGGPNFKHSEAFSFQVATDNQEETDRYWKRQREPVRLVQGPLGPFLADHPARADRRACGWRRRGKARLRSDDADAEDRHRDHRGGAAGLTWRRRLSAQLVTRSAGAPVFHTAPIGPRRHLGDGLAGHGFGKRG
jgi:predicted 3-demethylubiquinone-9 3-methyltransferase (glyoxalase superfamily)